MSSSDENDANEIDCDTCTTDELNQLFDDSLRISSEIAVSPQNDYILYLDHSRDFDRLAVGTSSKTVHLFDLNNTNGFTQLQKSDIDSFITVDNQFICDIRYGNESANSLFVAVTNGKVYAYDLRSKLAPVQTFQSEEIPQKPFACFDINANDSIVCAGTEQYAGEAYIVLFDVRQSSPLITYNDSHRDDLTQVRFHPSKINVLASGSTDGLINVFDTSLADEDDGLEYCLNTESSIQTINWLRKENEPDSGDLLSCITHTNDFQLFDVEDSELIFQSDRKEITKLIKRKSDCYLINCHTMSNGEIALLAGSNYNNGECLRSLKLRKQSKFRQLNNFIDNKQIIRCSVYNPKSNTLFTAGEGGIVTVWENLQTDKSQGHKFKERVRTKSKRTSKPY